jgi:CRP-like cAMP-binding protein
MYVLLSGELEVLSETGSRLAVIAPVTTVGEMGVVTRQERSATVRATCDSTALVIGRQAFESILRRDREMSASIYRNIVEIMCDKLVQDNAKVRQIQEREWDLEQSLKAKSRDLNSALNLLEEKAKIPRRDAEALIANMRASAQSAPEPEELEEAVAQAEGEVA